MSIARRVALFGPLFTLTFGMIAAACAVPTPVGISPTPTPSSTTIQPLVAGTGASNPQAFVDAYNVKGGSVMGSPVAAVERWGSACMQRFSSPGYGENAIVQPSCSGTAYNVVGELWAYARTKGSAEIGYPVMESHRWGNNTGWAQDFNGGSMGYAVIARGDAVKRVQGVRSGFLSWYYANGDAGGYLQWPISDEYGYCAGTRQDFQGGSIMWDSAGGVRAATSCAPTIGGREQRAVDWATAEKNSPDPTWSNEFARPWSGICEMFVEVALGGRGAGRQYASAMANYYAQLNAGRIRTDTNPPPGAIVFYSGAGGYGHNGVSLGNGQAISTQGFDGDRLPVRQHPVVGYLSNPYLGWAYAPDNWLGR